MNHTELREKFRTQLQDEDGLQVARKLLESSLMKIVEVFKTFVAPDSPFDAVFSTDWNKLDFEVICILAEEVLEREGRGDFKRALGSALEYWNSNKDKIRETMGF